MPIVMVTGGARSGKSKYAEEYCKQLGERVAYIACAAITDADMAHRVEMHRDWRPSQWTTIERYKDFAGIAQGDGRVYLLDCVTTMITNLMFDAALDYDACGSDEIAQVEARIQREIDTLLSAFADTDKTLVIVTNEVGLGIVPAYRLGSIFRDIAGRMNQYIAARADEVVCMISGLSLRLK